jgi:hypothetical protein
MPRLDRGAEGAFALVIVRRARTCRSRSARPGGAPVIEIVIGVATVLRALMARVRRGDHARFLLGPSATPVRTVCSSFDIAVLD